MTEPVALELNGVIMSHDRAEVVQLVSVFSLLSLEAHVVGKRALTKTGFKVLDNKLFMAFEIFTFLSITTHGS
jgi:hypothetical protein